MVETIKDGLTNRMKPYTKLYQTIWTNSNF